MSTPTLPPAGEMDIAGALAWARARIDQMDARVLLRHVLQCPAARLVAWPEQKLAAEDWANYRSLVERRVAGEPVALAGIWDSRYCGSVTRHHLYQIVVLCRPLAEQRDGPPSHAHEVLESGWFAAGDLPAELDPGHRTRIPHVFKVWRGEAPAHLDL